MHTYSKNRISLEMHGFKVEGIYFVDNFGETSFRVEFFRKDVLWYVYSEDRAEGASLAEMDEAGRIKSYVYALDPVGNCLGKREFENHFTRKYIDMIKKSAKEMRNMIA